MSIDLTFMILEFDINIDINNLIVIKQVRSDDALSRVPGVVGRRGGPSNLSRRTDGQTDGGTYSIKESLARD